MESIKIQIILGSTRQKRFSEKPGKWIFDLVKNKADIEAELLDLRDYPLPFFDEPAPPSKLNGKYSSDVATQWVKKIAEADGYILVTPEYNHGYPAVLKNALDYPYFEWNNKPVAFVAYGCGGARRAVGQLREVVAELKMQALEEAVHIAQFWKYLDEKGNLNTETFNEAAIQMIDKLIITARELKDTRKQKEN